VTFMTNEEFQTLVLEKLTGLDNRLGDVENHLDNVNNRLGNVENHLSNVDNRLENVENHLGNVDNRLENVENHLGNVDNHWENVKNRLNNVEGQLSETNGIVKALIHNAEELNAKYDGLLTITASKETVKRIESIVTRWNAKAATKDDLAEIRLHVIDELDAARTELKGGLAQTESNIREDLKSLFEITGEHEVKLRTLTRRPV
jgi:chromosome segregation ATPase